MNRPTKLFFAALLACLACGYSHAKPPVEPITATILAFSDGDTFTIQQGTTKQKVRLHYVDAPEIAHNRRQTDQPGGRAALEFAKQWEGKNVIITPSGESYGRIVADVVTAGAKESLGLALVARGHAQVDRRYHPPQSYLAAESKAHEEQRGLWKEPNPVAPWEWRKALRAKRSPHTQRQPHE